MRGTRRADKPLRPIEPRFIEHYEELNDVDARGARPAAPRSASNAARLPKPNAVPRSAGGPRPVPRSSASLSSESPTPGMQRRVIVRRRVVAQPMQPSPPAQPLKQKKPLRIRRPGISQPTPSQSRAEQSSAEQPKIKQLSTSKSRVKLSGAQQLKTSQPHAHRANKRQTLPRRKTSSFEEWAASRRHYPYARRIIAAVLAGLAVFGAAGVGMYVQHATGWDQEEWARYNAFQEPVDYSSAQAIAIPDEPDPEAGKKQVALRQASHEQKISSAPKPGEHKKVSIDTDGRKREFELWVPKSAQMNTGEKDLKPRPLVVVYHGKNESPEFMESYTQMSNLMDAIVAYPYGDELAWAGAPYAVTSDKGDLQFTKDILDSVSTTYQVDDQRVYAAGMSNGGGFALKLACEMPHEFSAIASVAGAFYPGTWEGCASDNSDAAGTVRFASDDVAPLLEIHGRKDDVIHYSGGERNGEKYLSALQLSGLYASRSGCSGAPLSMQVSDKVLRVQWPGCREGGDVTHLGIADAGHTWPGEPTGQAGSGAMGDNEQSVEDRTSKAITASSEIRAFFNRHQTRKS